MVTARGLKRTFKSKGKNIEAVKGIDLDVYKEEIVGFLGPNGAGKSTPLKMLCTLLEPSGGSVSIGGIDLLTDPGGVRRRIGYISQSGSTSSAAKAGDEIVWHGELHGMKRDEARQRGKSLLNSLDLADVWEQKCGTLSGGQRRRLDIVMGLIHKPELVFMDEPTTGLDPQARANLWGHIRKLRDDFGTTVFLTTHYMDEADALSDRLLIIDHGEIVGQGTPKDLKAKISGDTITLTMRDTKDTKIATKLGENVGISPPICTGNVVQIQVNEGASALPKLISELNKANVEAIGIEMAQPTLNDVFLNLTGRSLRD
jgi:ABC-2 type transport system ATP-binding protein